MLEKGDNIESDAELLQRIGWSGSGPEERQQRKRNFWVAFAFMSPAILLVSSVLLVPVGYNIYLSFTKWKKFKGLDEFAGIDNY